MTWSTTPPAEFVRSLRNYIRDESEDVPSPIAANAVRVVETVRAVATPDTTIESATVVLQQDACFISATVVHPPAQDVRRITIALRLRNWNGRFRGTGGAGYAGGNVANIGAPLRRGYLVGATGAGNPEGKPVSRWTLVGSRRGARYEPTPFLASMT